MAMRLSDIETDEVQLEVIECNCGYHIGFDATFAEQVDTASVICPACGLRIDNG
jgi:hypothetical protein